MKAHGRLAALALLVFSFIPATAMAQFAEEPPESASDAAGLEDDEDWYSEDLIRPETDLEAVDAAHAAYVRRTDLQLQRPESEFEPVDPAPPPGWLRAIARFIDSLGPIFRWAFYAAVAAVVLGVLYFLFGEAVRMRLGLGKSRGPSRPDDDLLDLRPDAARARSLLEEADALARAGRYAEAVRLLLFRSIEDIQQKIDGGVPTSLTAREIAGFERLPVRARGALEPIIRIVEHSFFGGRPVDQSGWTSARASYEDFAFGAAWK